MMMMLKLPTYQFQSTKEWHSHGRGGGGSDYPTSKLLLWLQFSAVKLTFSGYFYDQKAFVAVALPRDVNETKIWREWEREQLNEDENENETKNKFWEQELDQQPWEREQEQ